MLTLSLACTQTDRAAPILDGRIRIPGCEVIALPGETQDIFSRVLDDQAFDLAEMSMGSQIVQHGRGVQDYVALPIFLSRAFRHSAIYIRTDRGITRPEDLAGRTVGVMQYQQTVGLWVRGMLGDEYGVRTQDVNWVTGGLEQPGGGERIALELPDTIRLAPIAEGDTLNAMLAEGRIDALVATRAPSCITRGLPGVGCLFPDSRPAETEYFKKTKIFPMMHCLVMRRQLALEYPWLPVEVFRAFVAAKALALKDLTLANIPRISLAWIVEDAAETRRVLGANPWKYGFAESRHEIETLLRYAQNDGLIPAPIAPEDFFWPSVLGLKDQC
ncbi:MAG: ABC transporter substrate-binding protein [Rhodobacteraceae bacterium]|nr:ABC transporter substrate-binding protein [Paracoccaceae bacterium]